MGVIVGKGGEKGGILPEGKGQHRGKKGKKVENKKRENWSRGEEENMIQGLFENRGKKQRRFI